MTAPIAVVGAGVAGMAAALFLARSGRAVDLLERFETARPLGAGFLLQPTGMAALSALGLYGRVRAAGARVDRLRGETVAGRRIMDLPYADYRPGYYGLGVHRGVVFQALYDAVAAEPGVRLRTGCEIAGVSESAEGARLRLADGEETAPYPLVVAADGASSALRAGLGAASRDRAYEWACLWTIADDPGGGFDGDQAATLDQRYQGVRRFAGVLPVGRAPDASEGLSAALFWSLPARAYERWREAGLEAWKRELRAYWPRFARFIEPIEDPDRILLAVYRDVVMRRPHHGRVVFIGDAGHAMSPQLGQGANLGLLDAAALAHALAHAPSIPEALVAFADARRRQLWWYQTASRWLTPLFQSSNPAWGWARDLAFHPVSRLPWARREMLAAQAGMKTGILSQDRRDWTPGAAASPLAAPESPRPHQGSAVEAP